MDAPAASRREIWGWGLYDFANSPFATTILAVIFNRYFVEALAGGERGVALSLFGRSFQLPGLTFWTYTLAAATLIVALLAPLLGAIADYSGSKKRFLAFFCYLGAGATALLYFVQPGQYWRGAAIFVVAHVGFAAGNVFYNAFLPELSTPRNIGWISGVGFTFGYLGGAVLLAVNLVMLQAPELLGFAEPFTPQATFLTVAVWWAVFAVPTLLWLRDRPPARPPRAGANYVLIGARRVAATFRSVRRFSELSKFLAAYLVYNDGIQTVIFVAAIYLDQAVGMTSAEIIVLFLMIQATAFIGAIALGAVSDRMGNKRTIMLTLVLWSFVAVWGYAIGFTGAVRAETWLLGFLIGTILGGSQAASRALQGLLTPEENSAEFFSFFGIAQKFSSFIGPVVYGSVYALIGIQAAVLSLAIFFVIGLLMLLTVDEAKGIEQAREAVV